MINQLLKSLCTKTVLLAGMMALLAGCAMQNTLRPVINKAEAWRNYQQHWQKMTDWQVKGQISIATPQQALMSNLSASVQANHTYQLKLYGALGLGQVKLTQLPNQTIRYTAANGKTYQAQNAKRFMQQELGWTVPIGGLVYWLRGLPDPTQPAQKTLNQYGLISVLKQNGWTIRYFGYHCIDKQILPRRLLVVGYHLRVTIVLDGFKALAL